MNKLFFILILFCLSFFSNAFALTINGGISYTVDTARIESFSNIQESISFKEYEKFSKDENYSKNIELLKRNKKNYKDRYLTSFSTGNYAIRYKTNLDVSYYYDKYGNLICLEFDIGKGFPSKRVGYDSNGHLDTVTLDVSSHEQFVFDANKKLVAHWIGKNCYNEKGELISTRNR